MLVITGWFAEFLQIIYTDNWEIEEHVRQKNVLVLGTNLPLSQQNLVCAVSHMDSIKVVLFGELYILHPPLKNCCLQVYIII